MITVITVININMCFHSLMTLSSDMCLQMSTPSLRAYTNDLCHCARVYLLDIPNFPPCSTGPLPLLLTTFGICDCVIHNTPFTWRCILGATHFLAPSAQPPPQCISDLRFTQSTLLFCSVSLV